MSIIPRAVYKYQILQSYDKGHLCASCTRHHSWIYRQTAQSTQRLLDYNLKHILLLALINYMSLIQSNLKISTPCLICYISVIHNMSEIVLGTIKA
jgi:uncharacterized paraquat-inducible protein A